jgi:hypothetical protein
MAEIAIAMGPSNRYYSRWTKDRERTVSVAVNLLSEDECRAIQAYAIHDVDVPMDGWRVFLEMVLDRDVDYENVEVLIDAYNDWRRRTARCH